MKEETLKRANEIKNKISALEKEIKEFPRYIVDNKEYQKSGHMYIKRLLIKKNGRFKIKIPKGIYVPDLEFELSEEDLQALVDIRLKKIEELKEKLENL